MKYIKKQAYLLLIIFQLVYLSCKPVQTNELPTLHEAYQSYFRMGVAVSPGALEGEESQLIRQHFQSMTAENVMKMGPIHPEEDRYNWEPADRIVDFARTHDFFLRGHALCWHNQVPDWLFKPDSILSKEELLTRLNDHITTVVSRYKQDIYAWDVVNEAISDREDEFYRESKWFKICDSTYIAKAFEYAHRADPDAELYYNDYSVINPVKRKKIYSLLRGFKDSGVPVDGIGIQGHWSIESPSETQLRETLSLFADLDLKIQITELDISIYPNAESKVVEPGTVSFNRLMEKQADQYEMIFRVLREYKDAVTAVTFWNISDRHSWLDNFPVRGRKNYPLLFNEKLLPKEAYLSVVDFNNQVSKP